MNYKKYYSFAEVIKKTLKSQEKSISANNHDSFSMLQLSYLKYLEIICLVKENYYEAADIISRTLLELMIDYSYYMHNPDGNREASLEMRRLLNDFKLTEGALNHFKNPKFERISFAGKDREYFKDISSNIDAKIKILCDREGADTKKLKDLAGMSTEVKARILDETHYMKGIGGEDYPMVTWYTQVYRLTSSSVHNEPQALDKRLFAKDLHGRPYRRYDLKHCPEKDNGVMATATTILIMMFELAFREKVLTKPKGWDGLKIHEILKKS